ncbi:MAG TPA: type II secretion system protein GspJ, partial [Candidatus Sumerlaeota bacterium]|nr:type II secretion system protein GspJ [Candidatus Sumerlaeota bacterium]
EPAETRLLTGVSFLEITYYDGTVWQDSWDSTVQENTPPQAIRMKIGYENTETDGMDNSPLEMLVEIASRGRSQNQ